MLEELSERFHEEFVQANKGRKAHVLFESTDRNGEMSGYTENYIKVTEKYNPELIGKIVEVEI